jgi:branched-chain amino acid transport system ATP-binding protein
LSSAPLLEVDGLVKRFGGVRAVDGATFDVQPGTITSLIGPNGAGKTTAFNAIAGFHRADGGRVRFKGVRIDRKPSYAIARAGLVRTFQSARALTRMTVLENMMLAADRQPGEHLWRAFVAPRSTRSREQAVRERALELLATVRLDRLADDYAGTLSGGQRKLLEFARALMTEPALVMLDEPMAGVNPVLGLELLELMQSLRAAGKTFLLVEHDLEAVMMVSDRVLVMSSGKVIAGGTPDDVRRNPEVVDAYLGTYHETPAPGAATPRG